MYSSDDFVRFLYEVVLDRSDVEHEHIRHWAGQLERNEVTPAALFGVFLRTPEGRARFRHNPYFAPMIDAWKAPRSFGELSELVDAIGTAQIVDVGAMALDFEQDVYAPLLASGKWQVVGFEANEAECRARMAQNPDFEMFPLALGTGEPGVLHVNHGVATSSMLHSNTDRMIDYVGLSEWMTTVESRPLETSRLDDIDSVHAPALLKLDVQGGELAVLSGATRTLATTLVVHTETEFFPLYLGNPLFGDLDRFLGSHGFEFFDFNYEERYYHDDGRIERPWTPKRLLWADAVFVPHRERLDELDVAAVAALCWVMHDLYQAYDYCGWVLQRVDRRRGTAYSAAYRELLSLPPDAVARSGA